MHTDVCTHRPVQKEYGCGALFSGSPIYQPLLLAFPISLSSVVFEKVSRVHPVLHSASETPLFFILFFPLLHLKFLSVEHGFQKWKIILVPTVLWTMENCFSFFHCESSDIDLALQVAQVDTVQTTGIALAHKCTQTGDQKPYCQIQEYRSI